MRTNDNYEIARECRELFEEVQDNLFGVRIPEEIIYDKELSPDAFRVLVFLLHKLNDINENDGRFSYLPTIEDISSEINMPVSQVNAATSLLERVGYLSINQVNDGRLLKYIWQIHLIDTLINDGSRLTFEFQDRGIRV